MKNVDTILAKYNGREAELFRNLDQWLVSKRKKQSKKKGHATTKAKAKKKKKKTPKKKAK